MKRILLVLFFSAVSSLSFADGIFDSKVGGRENLLHGGMRFFRFILIIGAGFCLVRFGIHLVEALRNDAEDSRRNEVLKCIIDFAFFIALVVLVPLFTQGVWFGVMGRL